MASNPEPRPGGANAASQSQLASDPLMYNNFIAESEQACKECRRRKARCNKAIPTCDLCLKYRRHCLYEKHSRTPLTRKHLTEVEARLERAEAIIKQLRALVPPHLRTWERQTAAAQDTKPLDFARDEPPSGSSTTAAAAAAVTDGASSALQAVDADHQRMMEGPPVDDFEWVEEDPVHLEGFSPETIGDSSVDELPLSDGMASLSVHEKGGGYLGVASGAALLRLLDPTRKQRQTKAEQVSPPSIYSMNLLNPNRHVAEYMIDSYFRLYHASYPIIHEPTFRAQYSEVIPRPNGSCWSVLAYIIAAIGVWTSASSAADTLDLALFSQARSMLTFNFLEVGNLTLVQALTLAANYQQKRDKPNSGYNYLGLAVRMAMGLGLHKEFQGWNISPLAMEVRRRVWWTLGSLDMGATVTFSRPDVWPYKGVEVAFPMNVNDKDLTAASQDYPPESDQITPYSSITNQASFQIATHKCFEKVISRPFPSAEELLTLEVSLIEPWRKAQPAYFREDATIPPRYALPHAILAWRLRNLRIIMYRPFVIRSALRKKADPDKSSIVAIEKCLADAKFTIESISSFWSQHEHNRLAAWYGLYFIFQAALIPCICLRNEPSAEAAADWKSQIAATLEAVAAMARFNASCTRCYRAISGLCGRLLDSSDVTCTMPAAEGQSETLAQDPYAELAAEMQVWPQEPDHQPVGESAQTQINSVFSMMWPNVPPLEVADEVMGDDAGWMEFLRAGSVDDWDEPGDLGH